MIVYVKCFDSNKTICFKAIDNKLLNVLPNMEVSSLMNIKFDSESVYREMIKR